MSSSQEKHHRPGSSSKRRHDNNNKKEEDREHRPVVRLTDFVQRKGHVKAWQVARQRQERKRLDTAKALRSYQKEMKRAGYEPGQGKSRKRKQNINDKEIDRAEDETNNVAAEISTADEKKHELLASTNNKKRKKINPYQKSLEKAALKQQQAKKKQERRSTLR